MAKSVGGYFEIKRIDLGDILFSLTGCPIERLKLRKYMEPKEVTDLWLVFIQFYKAKDLVIFSNEQNSDGYQEEEFVLAERGRKKYGYALIGYEESNNCRYLKLRDPLNLQIYGKAYQAISAEFFVENKDAKNSYE